MNYLEKLINSNDILYFKDISTIKISGLYMLYTDFELKKITNQSYLKVGITNEENGLYGRLKNHFSGSTVKKILENGELKRLKSGTVLHRHMYFDKTLGRKFGLDFSIPSERKQFLRENCYFKVLPLKEFNWTEDKIETQKRFNKLHYIEVGIQNILRDEIRYIDSVRLENF